MAVAHSAASESHAATTGSVSQTSFSWTHTQTGTPQGVLVFVHVANSTGNPVSSVTYGGVTLTRVSGGAAIDSAGEAGRTDLFFAGSGLGTGNQTVTVNRANTTDIMYASAATVTALTDTNVIGIVLLEGDGALTVQSVTDGGAPTNSLRYAAAYSGLASPPPAGTGSTLLNSIDFGNYGIALVRETTAGTGARNVGFNNATTDDRAAVHVAVRELWNRTDTETVGAFTLTGNAATLTKTSPKVITGETGAFTLTGQPADLRHNPDIEAGTGAFTLTGQPAEAHHNVVIEGGTGAFTFTGNDASLIELTPELMDGGTGAFTLTGSAAVLARGLVLKAGLGTYALSGQPADASYGHRIQADAGAFSFAGKDATLSEAINITLSAGVGAFTVGGRTWAYGGWDNTTWGAVGENAQLLYGRAIAAAAGGFALAGNDATLSKTSQQVMDGGTGAFTLTGNPASTLVAVQLGGDVGKFFLPERNLRQWSEDLNNTYWTKNNSSITANSTTAPDGTLTADTLVENTANTTHTFARTVPFVADVKYTVSLYVKTYQNRDIAIVLGTTAAFGGASNPTVVFSPSTNTFTLLQGSPEAYGSADVGNGWYRIYITKTAVTTATTSSAIQLRTDIIGLYTGDGSSGAYIWGVQLEVGDLSSYDPTGAASATDVTFRRTRALQGGTGAFALAGNSATLVKGRTITAETGTFTAAGQPVTLLHNPRIEANTGGFALSGGAPALLRGWYLSGGAGEFTETGQPATFRRTWAIQGGTGTFALTGNPAGLTEVGAYEINAVVVAFTLSGQPANLAQSQTMPVTAGTFTLSEQAATLHQNRALAAETGAFAVSGQPAGLTQGYQLSSTAGGFSVAGNAATLRRNLATTAGVGSFTAAGQPATLTASRVLLGGTGAFSLTGNSAGLADTDELATTTGAFVLSGLEASFVRTSTARRRNVLIF